MSTYDRATGGGVGGLYIVNDPFTVADANQMKVCIDKMSLGAIARNVRWGGFAFIGSDGGLARDVNADGDYDLLDWFPYIVDNTSGHFSSFSDSNGATQVFQVRCYLRVNDAAISITPKARYGTTFAGITTVATISGAAACTSTSNAYTGSNQVQTITITQPSGVNQFKPQVTVAGTGGNPYSFWAMFVIEHYIQNSI